MLDAIFVFRSCKPCNWAVTSKTANLLCLIPHISDPITSVLKIFRNSDERIRRIPFEKLYHWIVFLGYKSRQSSEQGSKLVKLRTHLYSLVATLKVFQISAEKLRFWNLSMSAPWLEPQFRPTIYNQDMRDTLQYQFSFLEKFKSWIF